MSGNTHGDRKLSNPAVNEITTPNETASIPSSDADASALPHGAPGREDAAGGASMRRRLLRWYYGLKYRVFRRERRPRDGRRGLIVLHLHARAYADPRRPTEPDHAPPTT